MARLRRNKCIEIEAGLEKKGAHLIQLRQLPLKGRNVIVGGRAAPAEFDCGQVVCQRRLWRQIADNRPLSRLIEVFRRSKVKAHMCQ